MTWYLIAGDWQQFTALVKEEWNKLTDDDLTTFSGRSDQLSGLLQRKIRTHAREQADQKKSLRSPITTALMAVFALRGSTEGMMIKSWTNRILPVAPLLMMLGTLGLRRL